jgi:hypothetical protein
MGPHEASPNLRLKPVPIHDPTNLLGVRLGILGSRPLRFPINFSIFFSIAGS